MTNNLKEFRKNAHKALDSFLDVWGVEEFLIINQKDHDRNWAYAINQKEKELLDKFEEMLEDQTYPKLPTTAEAEDRMWRGKERNQLRKELRDRIKQLKEELKGGQDE